MWDNNQKLGDVFLNDSKVVWKGKEGVGKKEKGKGVGKRKIFCRLYP